MLFQSSRQLPLALLSGSLKHAAACMFVCLTSKVASSLSVVSQVFGEIYASRPSLDFSGPSELYEIKVEVYSFLLSCHGQFWPRLTELC